MNTSQQPSGGDPAEVADYARLSSLWWDQQKRFWPLHKLNDSRTCFTEEKNPGDKATCRRPRRS